MILNVVWVNDEFFVLTVDGFRRFFKPSLGIAVANKICLEDKEEERRQQ